MIVIQLSYAWVHVALLCVPSTVACVYLFLECVWREGHTVLAYTLGVRNIMGWLGYVHVNMASSEQRGGETFDHQTIAHYTCINRNRM